MEPRETKANTGPRASHVGTHGPGQDQCPAMELARKRPNRSSDGLVGDSGSVPIPRPRKTLQHGEEATWDLEAVYGTVQIEETDGIHGAKRRKDELCFG